MKPIVKETIEALKHWRSAFLSSTDQFNIIAPDGKIIHLEEVRDYLDGISEEGHACYASYLFKQLTNDDKQEILKAINFNVDFDEMCAIYCPDEDY
jgi:hypothetical protein